MHSEDPRQAEEPDRDEKTPICGMTRSQRRPRDEDRDEQGDDRDVRRDDEVLDRYEERRVALRVGEQHRENDGR